MRLAPAIALLAALTSLAGCAGLAPPPPRGDAAACRAAFESLDQAKRLFPREQITASGGTALNASVSRATNRIITQGCLTTGDDLAGLETLGARLGPRRPVNSGPAIPPTAVHVGILTGGFSDAGRAAAFFQSQGYRTRTIGAEKLGRRLYIGPVTSQGALDEAIALAAEAGFPSAYPSELFRFWR